MCEHTAADRLIALKERYPYQFGGKHIGLHVPPGWMQIFEGLCADVDAALGDDKYGFHWSQLKEKWGSARFYFELANDKPGLRLDVVSEAGVLSLCKTARGEAEGVALSSTLQALVSAAEQQTRTACYACGAAGELDPSPGWVVTLCPDHMRTKHDDAEAFTRDQVVRSGQAPDWTSW